MRTAAILFKGYPGSTAGIIANKLQQTINSRAEGGAADTQLGAFAKIFFFLHADPIGNTGNLPGSSQCLLFIEICNIQVGCPWKVKRDRTVPQKKSLWTEDGRSCLVTNLPPKLQKRTKRENVRQKSIHGKYEKIVTRV